MSSEDRQDDLLIRARRNQLVEGEERRLREALAASSETRWLFEAGCAFDREAPVLPGDDARIEGMLRAVQKQRVRARAAVPRRRVWPALATGLLFGGAAIAAIEGSRSLLWPAARESAATAPHTPQKPARVANTGEEGASAAQPGVPTQVSAPANTPAVSKQLPLAQTALKPSLSNAPTRAPELDFESSAPAVTSPGVPGSASARFDDVASHDTHASTAGELFAAANQARVQADSARAIAGYRRLEAEFPNSAEALSARLSLGISYLQAGQAGLALEQFRRYGESGRGPALGEALWGESQALRQLGQGAEEQRVLRQLLARFPESAYAGAARKRLSEP